MDSTTDKISFKVISWDKWSNDIIKKITEELKLGNMEVLDNLIFAPELNPDNPKDFCKHFQFDDVYENRVFVKDHVNKDCYWFINGDSTCLIYYPKLV